MSNDVHIGGIGFTGLLAVLFIGSRYTGDPVVVYVYSDDGLP